MKSPSEEKKMSEGLHEAQNMFSATSGFSLNNRDLNTFFFVPQVSANALINKCKSYPTYVFCVVLMSHVARKHWSQRR
jgi:hypothetical protein